MTARSRMTQRALVERDATDPLVDVTDSGNPEPPDWQEHIDGLPCWLYAGTGREQIDQNRIAVVEDLRLLVPVGTDITERDRINGIEDRRGSSILGQICNIRFVLLKRDHLEVGLTRVTS